mmetsp:Transcript_12146/g.33889  ORF Transcript_12146/g.33889 Transcript_12146/m.33889 type:complete len:434 (-) Transcript_12146:347-1648(-)
MHKFARRIRLAGPLVNSQRLGRGRPVPAGPRWPPAPSPRPSVALVALALAAALAAILAAALAALLATIAALLRLRGGLGLCFLLGVSCGQRLLVAGAPAADVLLWMERCRNRIAAIHASAHTVTVDIVVVNRLHAQVVKAVAHVPIFAPVLPVHAADALLLPGEILAQGSLAKRLQRPEHHGSFGQQRLIAIHDVGLLTCMVLQMLAEPEGDEHRVRIHFHRPVCRAPAIVRLHGVPDMHEELGVAGGAVLAGRDLGGLKLDGCHLARGPDAHDSGLGGAVYGVLVALEDAGAALDLALDQLRLAAVVVDRDDRVAEERWRSPEDRRARTDLVARPGKVVRIVLVLARVAALHARGPVLVLLVAGVPRVGAAPILAAVLRLLAALRRHPVGDGVCASVAPREAGRLGAERGAAPRLVVVVPQVGPLLTLGAAG